MASRSVLAAAGVALLACAACTGDDVDPVPVTTTDAAGRTTVILAEPTPEPTAPGDAGPTTPVPVPMSAVVLGEVTLQVPADWSVMQLDTPPRSWCLQPAEPLGPAVDGCAGVLVSQGEPLPGPAGAAYRAGMPDGWTVSSPAQPCPFREGAEEDDADEDAGADEDARADEDADADADEGDDAGRGDRGADRNRPAADDAAATSGGPDTAVVTATPDPAEHNVLVTTTQGESLTSVRTELAGRPATYETWRVSCSLSGETIAPQLWYVPDLELLVRDYLGQPQTVLVLETVGPADAAG